MEMRELKNGEYTRDVYVVDVTVLDNDGTDEITGYWYAPTNAIKAEDNPASEKFAADDLMDNGRNYIVLFDVDDMSGGVTIFSKDKIQYMCMMMHKRAIFSEEHQLLELIEYYEV